MEKQPKSQKKMKAFTVTVPEEVYQAAKIAAIKAGKTLRQVLLECLTAKVM